MTPHDSVGPVTLYHGSCLDVLAELPDASVDAVVTDPPYGLANTTPEKIAETVVRWVNGERDYLPGGKGFMGNPWDAFVPPAAVWDDCLRVLKPGGHVLAFAGSRTMDLMTLGLRMAGFDIRDSIAWLYGSGFPKSLDVSKAIDKATAPATPEAGRWQGFGTALKPAFEPVIVARKPIPGTVAANILEHGTGGLNIDGCRVGVVGYMGIPGSDAPLEPNPAGRWPANVVLDESQGAALDQQTSGMRAAKPSKSGSASGDKFGGTAYGSGLTGQGDIAGYDDQGGASRFFYVAKAPKSERPNVDGLSHPTVKPLALMRWLVRLVTPPGGTVLEPFAGSGTTIEAALLEGFNVIGVEREAEYLPLIEARIARALATDTDLFGGAA